jgi:RHS repeat-associated protein
VESWTSYSYNAYEQLQTETRQFKGLSGTYSVGYQYNLAGMLKTMTYTVNSWSKNVNYDYTYAAALKSVGTNIRAGYGSGDNTNVMSGLSYRGFGAVKLANYGNGRQLTANYDAKRLQMTYMSVHSASNVNDKIVSLDYNYYNGGANNGRIQKITDYLDGAYTTTYTYDDLNRLTNANATAFTRSYSYDAWANLTNVTATGAGETGSYSLPYATNASGAPLNNRINTGWHSYDGAGNTTHDGLHSYAYDAVNRVKSSDGNKFMEYDGDGRRVKIDESGAGNIALYSLWSSVLGQVVADIATGAYTYRAYVYSPNGQRLAQQGYDGQFQWIHTNHLGNGYKMTDSAGAVVFREEYDPHGQTVYRWAPNGPWYLSRKYTGYERDYGTNTDYANARQYHHNNNRFLQPDPLGLGAADFSDPQSLNLYSYVGNDPVNFVDPSGLLRAIWIPRQACVDIGDGPVCETYYDVYWIDDGGGWGPIGPIDPPDGGGGGQAGGPVQLPPPPQPIPLILTPPWACGVNPVTANLGFTAEPRGVNGHLRLGRADGQGYWRAPRGNRIHQGLDIAASPGTPLVANRDGRVSFAGNAGDAGLLIIINHGNGVTTRYAHLSSIGVSNGDNVYQGRIIGAAGQTGNARRQPRAEAHVHFNVQVNGANRNPEQYLNSPCP